jgi:hypothetical protein
LGVLDSPPTVTVVGDNIAFSCAASLLFVSQGLPLINNLKMDLIDNDEFKTGLTACSGIYLAKVSLTKLGL